MREHSVSMQGLGDHGGMGMQDWGDMGTHRDVEMQGCSYRHPTVPITDRHI